MALITNIEEIKAAIIIDGSFDYETILPFIPQAELELENILGDEFYQELLAYYETGNNDIIEFNTLLPYVQRPLVYFAFVEGFDIFNVSIGNNGIGIVETTGLAPASKQRTDALEENMLDNAYKGIELLLRFLETNKANYESWTSSSAYAFQFSFLISSALMFDSFYGIKKSRLTYINWRPKMSDIEAFLIGPIISYELLEELKTEAKSDSVGEKNLLIIKNVRKAIAYVTAGEMLNDPALSDTGKKYLGLVQHHINDHPDDYLAFKNSSIYIEPKVYTTFENDEDSNLAMFG